MDNKLSKLSKPVAWTDERGNLCTNRNKERGLESRYHQDYEKYTTPFYSQEYVSALLAELEAKDKRIAELEAKLATPVRLPTTSGRLGVAYTRVIPEVIEAIRAAGFKVTGDE